MKTYLVEYTNSSHPHTKDSSFSVALCLQHSQHVLNDTIQRKDYHWSISISPINTSDGKCFACRMEALAATPVPGSIVPSTHE